MSKINHYDVLGVPRDCDQSLIDTVYRSMVKVFHPDIFKGDKTFAQEKLKLINEAYAAIGNAERRKSYDAELKNSEGPGATEEIYEDERYNDCRTFDEFYEDEWKIAVEYFPKIDAMHKSLRQLNFSLAFAFQTLLISKKIYREAYNIFWSLQRDFLKAKFGGNVNLQSLALRAIETGNKRFALDLNRDLSILGEYEYLMVLEKLGEKYKSFSNDFYPEFGFDEISNLRKSFGLTPGRYKTQENKYFQVLSNLNVCVEMPNAWTGKTFESMEKLVDSGILSAESVRTAEKITPKKFE